MSTNYRLPVELGEGNPLLFYNYRSLTFSFATYLPRLINVVKEGPPKRGRERRDRTKDLFSHDLCHGKLIADSSTK